MSSDNNQEREDSHDLPEHLKRLPGLYVREADRIVDAPERDQAVARSYPPFQDKGPIVAGRRITVLTEKTTHGLDDEIRIVHVAEFTESGQQAYVMGPKPIFGEFINDELMTNPATSEDPLVPSDYSGVTLPSPAVDYNFEITSYTFNAPGTYRIQWRPGALVSNILVVTVEATS
jgi:hypothetical protein